MKQLPSILNDVIGPVMRGPSSSHTAASWRIARICIDILNEKLEKALVEFDRKGAWAPNYREQGTCMGINGGLLGIDITDARMKDTDSIARQSGISIKYMISSFPTSHPNTVRITLRGKAGKKVQVVAVSKGGGAFEIQSVDDFPVCLRGDLYEILIFSKKEPDLSVKKSNHISYQRINDTYLYEYKSSKAFSSEYIAELRGIHSTESIAVIHPVLPVLSGNEKELPFNSISTLIEYAEITGNDLGELGLIYEKCRSGLVDSELTREMMDIIRIIHKSIETGLSGTHYKDRILPQQSHLLEIAEKEGKIRASVVNRIIACTSALMESKSSMEVIVAAPTAGSCGTLGGALRAVAENINAEDEELVKAYFAAGLVGAYFAMGPGFSAEEHGCQVECGAASGMTAAGLTQLMGGTAKQALAAASLAIQNMIGLVCDPVADRVEVPCLGKNISAAVNAHASALMAVSGFDEVIPLDQVIETVERVGKSMPSCVKCTGKGGLAITKRAMEIKNKLK
jgi:L-serine dehydratase